MEKAILNQYLTDLACGNKSISKENIDTIVDQVRDGLYKQLLPKEKKTFSLRMSSIGKPYCKLWYDKNEPDSGVKPDSSFLMKMIVGDVVEAVFKGILRGAEIEYEDGFKSTLQVGGERITGEHDLSINGSVDDVKSASPWSYKNKFKDGHTVQENDSFGYVSQLVGYSLSTGLKVGGWWVVDKSSGSFKYIDLSYINVDKERKKMEDKILKLKENKFERCFKPIDETFYKKKTGNKVLPIDCKWCNYRHKCWPTLREIPSLVSKADNPPINSYVEIHEKYLQK